MGLDISVYNNLKLLNENPTEKQIEKSYDGDNIVIYQHEDFPDQLVPLINGAIYAADGQYDFPAGSYSGYNRWREWLAKLAEYPEAPSTSEWSSSFRSHSEGAWATDSGPFWELITFSDCEGTIASESAKKLYVDFLNYYDRAILTNSCHDLEKYRDWMKAFEIASDNGCVVFH